MIDGIKILVALIAYNDWLRKVGIRFYTRIDMGTGEILGQRHRNTPEVVTYIHIGKLGTYNLKVIETHTYASGILQGITFYLTITGSLHKNHHSGSNVDRFTVFQLHDEIAYLCRSLHLSPENCIIQNLEVGLNLPFAFSVTDFTNNRLLMHSTKPFVKYLPGKNGIVIGKSAIHHQYSIKIYCKSLQCGSDDESLRVEVRTIKMQFLKQYNIKTLADLLDYGKLKKLSTLILVNWDLVFICDPDIHIHNIPVSNREKDLLQNGKNLNFWVNLHRCNPKKFFKDRSEYRRLTAEHGCVDYHAQIRSLIADEIDFLLQPGSFLPGVETPVEACGKVDFTIKVTNKVDPSTVEDMSDRPSMKTFIEVSSSKPLSAQEHPAPSATIDPQDASLHLTPLTIPDIAQNTAPNTADQYMTSVEMDVSGPAEVLLPPQAAKPAESDIMLDHWKSPEAIVGSHAPKAQKFTRPEADKPQCHSSQLGVVDEDATRTGNVDASSGTNTLDGIPSKRVYAISGRMSRLIRAGRNIVKLLTQGLIRQTWKDSRPP